MLHATFATPDLTVFCCLDELGLVATGQLIGPDRAVIECRVTVPDPLASNSVALLTAAVGTGNVDTGNAPLHAPCASMRSQERTRLLWSCCHLMKGNE